MNPETPLIDIRPDHWVIVRGILKKHVPQYAVWAFGSRAAWKAKEFSDLDLAIITDKPLSLDISASLSEDFSNSDLPYKVDIVDWATTSESFRKIIERDKVEVQVEENNLKGVSGWRQSRWGDEVTLEYGKAIRGYSQTNGKYRVFGSNGCIGWTSEALTNGPGVILGRKGAYRGVEFSREPFWVIDTGYYLVPKSDLDMRWLYYAVKHYKLGEVDDGSPVPSTTRAAVYMLDLDVPPKHEQHAIAHILGTLDDKIELNRKQNETLEAMARAMFKAWFVDFEPVRAKMEGRWQRGQSLPGLPAHLYDIFPDRLVDSELGDIPQGWGISALGDFVEAVKGRSYKSEELAESTTALVTLKSFARGGGYRTDGLKSFTGKYKQEQIIEPGEVVIACTDVTQAAELIGRTAIVRGTRRYQTLVASLDTMIVRPRSERVTRAFLYHLGRSESFVAHTYSHTTGTTVLHLGKEAIPTYRFVLPPRDLVCHFDLAASNSFVRVDALENESERLIALRDTLLPKLTSGELRVADAECIVEATV